MGIGAGDQVSMRFRIIGEAGTVSLLAGDLVNDDEFELQNPRPIVNPAEFRLDVAQIAEIVGTVHAVVLGGALIPALQNRLSKGNGGRIVIESPLGRVVFEPRGNLSEDEIRKALKKLSDLQ